MKWEGRREGRIVHGSQIESPGQVSSPFQPKIMLEQITFQVHLYYHYLINTRTMLLSNFHLFYIGLDQQVVRMLTLRHVDLALASIFEHNRKIHRVSLLNFQLLTTFTSEYGGNSATIVNLTCKLWKYS